MVHKGGPQADAELWGDDEEGGDDELDREWRARREEHWSSGYREGVEVGKHEAVQAGFDEGYALGAAAGFECGAARGAATMLRAMAPRLPADLSGGLQQAPTEQQQQQQQPGGAPAPDAISDIPFQEMQREVCQALMSAPPPADAAQPPALPPRIRAAVDASATSMGQLGLQAPRPSLQ